MSELTLESLAAQQALDSPNIDDLRSREETATQRFNDAAKSITKAHEALVEQMNQAAHAIDEFGRIAQPHFTRPSSP